MYIQEEMQQHVGFYEPLQQDGLVPEEQAILALAKTMIQIKKRLILSQRDTNCISKQVQSLQSRYSSL